MGRSHTLGTLTGTGVSATAQSIIVSIYTLLHRFRWSGNWVAAGQLVSCCKLSAHYLTRQLTGYCAAGDRPFAQQVPLHQSCSTLAASDRAGA